MQHKARKVPAVKLYESAFVNEALGDVLHPGGLGLTARVAEIAGLSKDSYVLDIACGKGATALFLSRQYGCCVAGIDLSHKLIAIARGKAEAEKLSQRADFAIANAGSLPWSDCIFDAAICECSFSLIPDKEDAAQEIKRVLKCGGRLVITDVVLRGEIAEELQTPLGIATCIAGAAPLEGYLKLFAKAGFQNFYTEDHSQELKKIAYHMLASCGSTENLSAKSPTGSGKIDALPSVEAWRNLFKQGRPGYALIAVTKPYQ